MSNRDEESEERKDDFSFLMKRKCQKFSIQMQLNFCGDFSIANF